MEKISPGGKLPNKYFNNIVENFNETWICVGLYEVQE